MENQNAQDKEIRQAIQQLKDDQLLVVMYYNDDKPVILIARSLTDLMYWHISETDIITLYNMLEVILNEGVEFSVMNGIWVSFKDNAYTIMIKETSISFSKEESLFFLGKLQEFITNNIQPC